MNPNHELVLRAGTALTGIEPDGANRPARRVQPRAPEAREPVLSAARGGRTALLALGGRERPGTGGARKPGRIPRPSAAVL